MHTAVYWFGFLGAWLLFAGPIFQASVELRAEDEASARMKHAADGLPPPPQVSNWWWLLPPVRMVLSSRRSSDWVLVVVMLLITLGSIGGSAERERRSRARQSAKPPS